MRCVFLGTSAYAATVLRRLSESPYRPALVVTPPDRRRGRGRRMAPPPAADAASELGIELLQAANVNEPEASGRVLGLGADVAVVCAFGQLVKEPLLSSLEMLNIHPSLLPRWRGAAPIERSIIAGDERTGVTIMRLTEGLDSGPVALQESLAIGDRETFGELEPRLAKLGGELILRALEQHAAGTLELSEQDESGATYAEKLEAADRRLDPGRTAAELDRLVRALTPHVGAYLELAGGGRLGVGAAEVWAPEEGDAAPRSIEVGELRPADGRLLLGCAEGVLSLTVVQPPGKKPMGADAYLRGHPPPGRVA